MRNNPTASIIIITCNNDNTVVDAINSALAQDFQDIEVIVVNDGSTDKTASVLSTIAAVDERIKAIHLENNCGRAGARNTGLAKASGRYITFLDADDTLPRTAVKYMVHAAEKDEAEVVVARIAAFDGETRQWLERHYTDEFLPRSPKTVRMESFPALVNNNAIIGRLYRAEYLSKNDIRFPENRRCAEDVSFSFFSLFHADRILLLPTLSYYYSSGNFLGTASPEKVCDARDALLEISMFCAEYGSDEIRKAVQDKVAEFCTKLDRAERAYLDPDGFIQYVKSLGTLAETLTPDTLQKFDEPTRTYFEKLIDGDSEGALVHYPKISIHKNATTPRFEARRQKVYDTRQAIRAFDRDIDIALSELDSLYNSSSWRISRPIRAATTVLRTCMNFLLRAHDG